MLADHECSGYSIIGALAGGVTALRTLPAENTLLDPAIAPEHQKAVGTYDTAKFPSYKILPDGFPESRDIDGKLLIGFAASGDRYENWLTNPTTIVDSLLSSDIRTELGAKGYGTEPIDRKEKTNGFYIRGQAVGRTQAVHTAADIPVSAYSTNDHAHRRFVGVQKNTDVFFMIARALLGGY